MATDVSLTRLASENLLVTTYGAIFAELIHFLVDRQKEKTPEAARKALHEVLVPRWPVFAGGPPFDQILGRSNHGRKKARPVFRFVRRDNGCNPCP